MKSPIDQKLSVASLWIAVAAIGVAIVLSAQPNVFLSIRQIESQVNYAGLLISEMTYNVNESIDVLEQLENDGEIVRPALYRSDVYQAGIQSGYLFSFSGDTPKKIMDVYTSLSKVERLNNEEAAMKEVLTAQLRFRNNMVAVLEDVRIDRSWLDNAKSANWTVKIGIFVMLYATIGLAVHGGLVAYFKDKIRRTTHHHNS